MKNLTQELQARFNTVTKIGTVNDSFTKRVTRFDSLISSFDDVSEGFILTDSSTLESYEVTKYQLLGLVIENPAKLTSIAIKKGGVDNTMLSYSASTVTRKVEVTPETLVVGMLKAHYEAEINHLRRRLATSDVEAILASIEKTGTFLLDDNVQDVSKITSLINIEKYKEQLNKFEGCFNPAKSAAECIQTGNSKGLQVTLFDAEIVDGKIQSLYKITDDTSKEVINARLVDLGFKGIKWLGKTSLSVDLG